MTSNFQLAAGLNDLKSSGALTVHVGEHTIALFLYADKIYAVDNRCPHMGFPLAQGSIKDGILTCYWHYARFDIASGGTFDQWADDVPTFPVELRGDQIWVDVSPKDAQKPHQRKRLQDGLERNIPLVMAKAVNVLLDNDENPVEPFRTGLTFGTRYRQMGWGQGLTIHTCMMNMLPHLQSADHPRALYHGLSAAAADCDGQPPRFVVSPLPLATTDFKTLKQWFRQFIEVRDSEGAERCIISALRAGADHVQMAEMLFAAATDHRYLDVGHTLDFINKAFEALDTAGWEHAETVLTSLASSLASADRMEESNAWRHPVDLITLLEDAFEQLPDALQPKRQSGLDRDGLSKTLLADNPQAAIDALLNVLREGAAPVDVAGVVAYAAALRIARFHTSNEFGDWDTALHTFTFANAVQQGLRRVESPELVRGIFDAAISVFLDRFLNIPAARLPEPNGAVGDPTALLKELPTLLDRQQQVDQVGNLVAKYFYGGGDADQLMSVLGGLLLREDRNFHTIQCIEATFRQYHELRGTQAGVHVLIAAARYLAAHAPTMRAQGQTYQIAYRLTRGEKLFEEV